MQLSQESYRTRWLVLVILWVAAAWMFFDHARLTRTYLENVSQLGLRGVSEANTPLRQLYPAFAADAQTWVRHALALTEGDAVRLRWTTIDNAPNGREVHWNSAWAWSIAGAGWIFQLFTGLPLPTSIERATIWLNPCVLLVLIIVLSAWTTKRAGLLAGVFVAIAMMGNDRMFEGFFPSYVDHHGLLTIAVFGMVLGAVLMGGGWWQASSQRATLLPASPEAAQRAAAFSAVCGGFGLWVSAASVIPPIAIVGMAGLLAVFIHGRATRETGANFSPSVWQTWGRVGSGVSLFFYLLEYFPNHVGLRLEPNHPFHALAWFGAGELIAQISQWRLAPATERRLPWKRMILPAVAASLAPLTILVGGVKVFTVIDPFLARLHSDYIQEFLPIWKTIRGFDAKMAFQILVVDNAPLLAGLATLSFLRRQSPILLWFATLAALLFNLMAWWQSRWLLNASGAQVCLALVLIGCWTASLSATLRWTFGLLAASVLYLPSAVMRNVGITQDVSARRVAPRDAAGALARDIAARLRASQPNGDIVLLASPNASTCIGYYGRFKTLGTLYWENVDGLKAAASIFSATSDAEAATLIRAHHVTHIAIVSDENFISQYYELLHPGSTAEEVRRSFGARLMVDRQVPQWLQMIPYRTPDDLTSLKTSVMLFKVNFQQNLADAVYNVALAQIEAGAADDADRTLDVLLQRVAPNAYQPWLRKGELALKRHSWTSAAELLLKGISLAPAADRTSLYVNYAKPFYDAGQPALAIQFYRTALSHQPSPDAACYLSWVLATTTDESLRNGREALQLAQEAVKADANSPSYLNSLAAAFAETGRFAEAVDAADRALASSRMRGEPENIQQIFAQRLAVIKAGKPLRN